MSIESLYLEEKRYDDIIFTSNKLIDGTDVLSNKQYNNTHVRTWYYSNVTDDIWMVDDDIPLLTEYTSSMFPISKFGKGVFIVKKYTIVNNSLQSGMLIDKFINNNNNNISSEDKERISKYLLEATRSVTPNNNVNLRFVTYIPYKDIVNNHVVKYKNYKVTTQLEKLYDIEEDSELVESGINIKISVSSLKNESTVYICGEEVKIRPTFMDNIQHDTDVTQFKYVVRDLLTNDCITYGYMSDTIEDIKLPIVDIVSRDNRLETIPGILDYNNKHMLDKTTKVVSWRKQLLEHEVSVNKATAYGINNETNVVKLEKEELSRNKDEIKFIKDILF